MTLEASLSVIPAVPPVVVVVLHIVVVGDLVVVLVQHEGLGLVVGEDLELVLTAHHVIVLVLADNHLKVIMTLKTTFKYQCSGDTDFPYPGVIRLRVVDPQRAAGGGAADGDPGVVSTVLRVSPTGAALSVGFVAQRTTNIEGLRVDEEAVVELTVGVAGDLDHLALS